MKIWMRAGVGLSILLTGCVIIKVDPYIPLFNGKNINGWTQVRGREGAWRADCVEAHPVTGIKAPRHAALKVARQSDRCLFMPGVYTTARNQIVASVTRNTSSIVLN